MYWIFIITITFLLIWIKLEINEESKELNENIKLLIKEGYNSQLQRFTDEQLEEEYKSFLNIYSKAANESIRREAMYRLLVKEMESRYLNQDLLDKEHFTELDILWS